MTEAIHATQIAKVHRCGILEACFSPLHLDLYLLVKSFQWLSSQPHFKHVTVFFAVIRSDSSSSLTHKLQVQPVVFLASNPTGWPSAAAIISNDDDDRSSSSRLSFRSATRSWEIDRRDHRQLTLTLTGTATVDLTNRLVGSLSIKFKCHFFQKQNKQGLKKYHAFAAQPT